MKNSIISLLFLLLLSYSLPAEEKGSLKGKITDDNYQAVTSAAIKIESTKLGAKSKKDGSYKIINIPAGSYICKIRAIGFRDTSISIIIAPGAETILNVKLTSVPTNTKDVLIKDGKGKVGKVTTHSIEKAEMMSGDAPLSPSYKKMDMKAKMDPGFNTESYDKINDNKFLEALSNPVSTFSADVDAASYSNMRRYLTSGSLPPKDAVRTEELINYFKYDYKSPTDDKPFSINTEVSSCPWNEKNMVVMIGLQGKKIPAITAPPNNLVFLLDVSGSMNVPNKLPLLKSSFKLLVDNLRQQDKVAIVVYAGAAGLVLPSTSCAQKDKIIKAIDNLQAGGSTAGGQGIILAYKIAQENFIPNGNNRIILATDGDFNVGASSDSEMERLIEEKRNSGVYISVLGFGMGNYKDSKMEKIADKGNGNYAYIDNLMEAKKVLVTEMGGTLLTIAKDVKIQIEFNPAKVKKYRLIGYENRLLSKEDFNDDKKDAGDIGSGHCVTALYEIEPNTGQGEPTSTDLKYQKSLIKPDAFKTNEMMTVKFRYKEPKDTISKLIEQTISEDQINLKKASQNYVFATAVAEFAMLLRNSEYKANSSFAHVISAVTSTINDDVYGYKKEFLDLIKIADKLQSKK